MDKVLDLVNDLIVHGEVNEQPYITLKAKGIKRELINLLITRNRYAKEQGKKPRAKATI